MADKKESWRSRLAQLTTEQLVSIMARLSKVLSSEDRLKTLPRGIANLAIQWDPDRFHEDDHVQALNPVFRSLHQSLIFFSMECRVPGVVSAPELASFMRERVLQSEDLDPGTPGGSHGIRVRVERRISIAETQILSTECWTETPLGWAQRGTLKSLLEYRFGFLERCPPRYRDEAAALLAELWEPRQEPRQEPRHNPVASGFCQVDKTGFHPDNTLTEVDMHETESGLARLYPRLRVLKNGGIIEQTPGNRGPLKKRKSKRRLPLPPQGGGSEVDFRREDRKTEEGGTESREESAMTRAEQLEKTMAAWLDKRPPSRGPEPTVPKEGSSTWGRWELAVIDQSARRGISFDEAAERVALALEASWELGFGEKSFRRAVSRDHVFRCVEALERAAEHELARSKVTPLRRPKRKPAAEKVLPQEGVEDYNPESWANPLGPPDGEN